MRLRARTSPHWHGHSNRSHFVLSAVPINTSFRARSSPVASADASSVTTPENSFRRRRRHHQVPSPAIHFQIQFSIVLTEYCWQTIAARPVGDPYIRGRKHVLHQKVPPKLGWLGRSVHGTSVARQLDRRRGDCVQTPACRRKKFPRCLWASIRLDREVGRHNRLHPAANSRGDGFFRCGAATGRPA